MRDGTRHIKDDMRAVDDPSARILGWSQIGRLLHLRQQIVEAERGAENLGNAAIEAVRTAEVARACQNAARELLGIAAFSDIDPQHWSEEVIRLRK